MILVSIVGAPAFFGRAIAYSYSTPDRLSLHSYTIGPRAGAIACPHDAAVGISWGGSLLWMSFE